MKKILTILSFVISTFCSSQSMEFVMDNYFEFYANTTNYDSLCSSEFRFDADTTLKRGTRYVLSDDKKNLNVFKLGSLVRTADVVSYNEVDNLIKITIVDVDIKTKEEFNWYFIYNKTNSDFIMYYFSPVSDNLIVGYKTIL